MTDAIEKRAEHLKKTVNTYFERWQADPVSFARDNPDIIIAIERSGRTEVGAMRSIADSVMAGTGFDYRVCETLGSNPFFLIGQYDERAIKR